MRFGSVCSGIEAASVAFAPLGWEPAWLSEVDIAASAVLAARLGATAPVYPLPKSERRIAQIDWGDRIVNWGDMTKLPALVRSGDVEAPDVLCGGTPCQGFSLAGLRGGLKDPRGQLTLSFVELLDAIDVARTKRGEEPCVALWENVPGVLSDKGNAFGNFIAALAGNSEPVEPGPRPESGRSSTHWSWKKGTCEHVPKWSSAGLVVGPKRTVGWRRPDAQYFGLAQRRSRMLVVASSRAGFDPAEILFEFDGVRRDTAPSREAREDVAGTLDARTTGGGFPGTDGACSNHVVPHSTENMDVGCIASTGDISHCLNAGGMGRQDYETETLIVQPLSVALRGRDGGQLAVCVTGDLTHTLRAEGFDASEDGTGRGNPIVVHGTQDPCVSEIAFALGRNNGGENALFGEMAVRRLMPIECERLQGFPDGWTDVPIGKKRAADGPRYKQLGNSWPVPMITWAGRRIDAHIRKLDLLKSDVTVSFDDWMMAP